MSFILEALKKSEQQRQQQNAPQSKVRKRTFSLKSSRSGHRWLPWLVAGLLPLLMLGGWFYRQTNTSPVAPPVIEQATATPAPASRITAPEPPAATPAALESTAAPAAAASVQQPAIDVEPAPVPRALGSASAATKAAAQQVPETAPIPRRPELHASRKTLVDEAAAEQPEPRIGSTRALPQESSQLPLFNDLSQEMRAQMPILDMSMHFYTPEPGRRMVRINDHLLHEGNWVDSNLQLVEITPTGAILDFLGKSFELRRARR